MSATATLPLPLELTKPVELSSSLEDAIREAFEAANTKYNHETQVRVLSDGSPQCWGGGGGSHSNSECESGGLFVTDVLDDINIDDNNIDL